MRTLKQGIARLLAVAAMLAFTGQSAYALTFGPGTFAALKHTIPSRYLHEQGSSLPPIGHLILCAKSPEQCALEGNDTVSLGIAEIAVLGLVHQTVNAGIRPRNDNGSADRWSIAPAFGDCEDYALTKRAELIRRGWPSRALRIAVAQTRRGEGHAVLVVRTTLGDVVLDNRKPQPLFWYQEDLKWIKIQSRIEPGKWQKVRDGGLPATLKADT
jgi:predicted transglutaminase-like cysteine proteinase